MIQKPNHQLLSARASCLQIAHCATGPFVEICCSDDGGESERANIMPRSSRSPLVCAVAMKHYNIGCGCDDGAIFKGFMQTKLSSDVVKKCAVHIEKRFSCCITGAEMCLAQRSFIAEGHKKSRADFVKKVSALSGCAALATRKVQYYAWVDTYVILML